MSISKGISAAVIEWLPFVRLADFSGDGDQEIVVGPKPSSKTATVLRHCGDRSMDLGPVVLTLGGE